jgi:hypothetical protein
MSRLRRGTRPSGAVAGTGAAPMGICRRPCRLGWKWTLHCTFRLPVVTVIDHVARIVRAIEGAA